MKIVSGS
jgi:hypothetical protein